MHYIMLAATAMVLAVDFALNKLYQRKNGVSPAAGLRFNALLGLFTAVLYFAVNGFNTEFTVYSFVMAGVLNLFVTVYNIIGFRILKSGTMALYTLFLMSGGMVLPYIFGIFALNEPLSLLRTAALILILIGVILSNSGNKQINTKDFLLCVAVFFLNGLVSIVMKLHQTDTGFETVGETEFLILGGIFRFLFSGLVYLFIPKDSDSSVKSKSALFYIAIVSAGLGGLSCLLQLIAASNLPATVLYPFVTGGTIVLSTITGILVFREKVSKKLIASVILCFAGTVMFL